MNKTIGVLGCGWLGTPLATNLISKGYSVKGSTTKTSKFQELEDLGILPYEIKITQNSVEGDITGFLKDVKTVIINIPPGLRGSNNESFVKKIAVLTQHLEKSQIKNLLFVSSTSVYGNTNGEITEETTPNPVSESGKQLWQAEKLLQSNTNFKTTIVRFGGLIGPDRHPVNHLAGKTDLKNGDGLVNLIHLDDCILMIATILEKAYWNLIFNGVFPSHPTKKAYYTQEALKRGLVPPKFTTTAIQTNKKIIKSALFYVKSHQLLTTIVS